MDQYLQLLVHAGAPSTRHDDGKYAVQAEAYANIRSSHVRRLRDVCQPTDESSALPPSTCLTGQDHKNGLMKSVNTTADEDATVYVENTQLAYVALESQLRGSSRANGMGKSASDTNSSRDLTAATTSSKRKSQPSQSSYLVSPQLERSSHGRRVPENEHYQRLSRQARKPNPVSPTEDQDLPRTDGSDKENSGQNVIDNLDSTSELPTSYSLSADASARSGDRPRLPEKSVSDPGTLAAGLAKTMTEGTPLAVPSLPQRRLVERDVGEAHITKASEVRLPSKSAQPTALGDAEHRRYPTPSSDIFPSGPQTSIKRFSTHVTPALQHLVQNSAVATSFNPVSQTRELEASERGFWLVPCQDWSDIEQVAIWKSLETSIGNAGWGVWCTRGQDRTLADEDDASPIASTITSDLPTPRMGPIRVWCWGEVVRHVYLLLYVASKSKVRRLGLQWIDSDDHVVIQMRKVRD